LIAAICLALCVMILVIISSFPVVSTLPLPPKVIAQMPFEGAKVLIILDTIAEEAVLIP
jgi:hypothetical protein